MSDFKARMRRWLKRIVIVLAVFMLPPVAFYFYSTWQGDRELRGVLAELDAAETPWRWDDLIAARPKLHPSEDLRPLILSIHASVPRGYWTSWTITAAAVDRPPQFAIPPEHWERFKEIMLTAEDALAEAAKTKSARAGRFQFPWNTEALTTELDDVRKIRSFISLLQNGAAWHAQRADLDPAMDICLAMQRLWQSVEDEPTLIVHLVRMALQSISWGTLQRVVAQGQPRAERLEELQRAWEQFDHDRALINCLRGERAYTHRMFEAFAAGRVSLHQAMPMLATGAPETLWEKVSFLYLQANLKQAHAWSLRHLTAHIEAVNLPEPQRTARQSELEQKGRQAPGAARLLTPTMEKVLRAHRRVGMQSACVIVGLAAERFRIEYHRWPKSLEELCPKFLAKTPDDPYAGAPLQLRITDDGIVIYSVGPDGKQRGTYQEDAAANRPGSIPCEFRLWNVNQRRQVDVRQP